jgi:hypothetical protein
LGIERLQKIVVKMVDRAILGMKKGFPKISETLGISIGGPEGNRTLDLLNAIQALSQLSYKPVC